MIEAKIQLPITSAPTIGSPIVPAWYIVRGRGSGRDLDGYHYIDPNEYSLMTFCGVRISSAFKEHRAKPRDCCRVCKREAKKREEKA